jgi:hypothetical protein
MPVAHPGTWSTRSLAVFLLAGLAIGGVGSPASGDRITVRGGGQIRGKLIPDKDHPGQSLFIGEVGKTPMVFTKDQIVQVTPEKSALDEYVVRLVKDRTSAQEEYDFGAWCEENKLADLAQVHYEQAVKRDSTFEPAHQKLGHILLGGRWLNGDEVKEAQGMVKYKGRWVTPEEKERREMMAATAAEGNTWVKRIVQLRDAYVAGPVERSREAERRLLAINEPKAVGPVLKVMGDDEFPLVRSLAARVLEAIPGQEASSAVVGRLLVEEDEAVRRETMNAVARRDSSEVVPLLMKGLRSTARQVINRSAWALANLNAVSAVPKLVPSLVTYEYQVVMVDPGPSGPGMGYGPGAGGSGFASYSSRSIPILTPPAVGPGAVAFGATSIPSGPGAGSSIGGGSSGGPVARMVQVENHNEEVLAALVKLTGRDFGYDVPTWKQWVATSFKVTTPPSRRVPEP